MIRQLNFNMSACSIYSLSSVHLLNNATSQQHICRGLLFFTSMEYRKSINQITPDTREWTCKVQLIEKSHPRESQDGNTIFQLLRFEDAEGHQVGGVIYGPDIGKRDDKLKEFHSYVISTAKVRLPFRLAAAVHRFEWVIDGQTVVKEVNKENVQDLPLAPPRNLQIVPLLRADEQPFKSEFDILAVVISCGSVKYVGANNSKCRELILMDTGVKATLLSLWEDYADVDGSELAQKIAGFPVIVAKRVTRIQYNGGSLSTRFNTVILIDPPYPQVTELRQWVNVNEEVLTTYRLRSSRLLSSSPAVMSLHDSSTPIAELSLQTSIQLHRVDGMISIPSEDQNFYELICSHCGHRYRTGVIDEIDCFNCNSRAMLAARVCFEVNISDDSGMVRATISGDVAEKMLEMTAPQVYELTKREGDMLPLDDISLRLNQRLFQIQLRKLFSRSSELKLSILSFMEKSDMLQLPPSISTEIPESSNVDIPQITPASGLKKDLNVTTSTAATKRHQIAPKTPAKKK